MGSLTFGGTLALIVAGGLAALLRFARGDVWNRYRLLRRSQQWATPIEVSLFVMVMVALLALSNLAGSTPGQPGPIAPVTVEPAAR
jgi:hypothetical protein